MSVKFSVGYNYSFSDFCHLLGRYRQHIESVYFPLPRNCLGSGRGLHENDQYDQEFYALIRYCRSQKITPIVLLNPAVLDYSRIPSLLECLHKINAKEGLSNIVVKDAFLLKMLRQQFPWAQLEVSILSQVNTEAKAARYAQLGANTIAVSRDHIRDLALIEKMGKWVTVKVLVNEGCMKNGIFCDSHYAALSEEINYRYSTPAGLLRDLKDAPCMKHGAVKPEMFFAAPFVRPEDLDFYDGISGCFKLSTRNGSTRIIENILQAYIERRYEGNLLDLLNSPFTRVVDFIDNKVLDTVPFFKTLSTCNDDCENCGFCSMLLAQSTDPSAALQRLERLVYQKPASSILRFRLKRLKQVVLMVASG